MDKETFDTQYDWWRDTMRDKVMMLLASEGATCGDVVRVTDAVRSFVRIFKDLTPFNLPPEYRPLKEEEVDRALSPWFAKAVRAEVEKLALSPVSVAEAPAG